MACRRIGHAGRTITDLQGEVGQGLLSELEEVSDEHAQVAAQGIVAPSSAPFVIFDETAPQNAADAQQGAPEPAASAGADAPGEARGLGVGMVLSENLRALGIMESCYLCKEVFEKLMMASDEAQASGEGGGSEEPSEANDAYAGGEGGQRHEAAGAASQDGARCSSVLPSWLLEAAQCVSRDRRMCREVLAPRGGFAAEGARLECSASCNDGPAIAFGRSPFHREFQYFAIRIGDAPKLPPGAAGGLGGLGPVAFGVCLKDEDFDPGAPCGVGTVVWRMGAGGGSGGTLAHGPGCKVVKGEGRAGGIRGGLTFGSVVGVKVDRNGTVAFFKDRADPSQGGGLEQVLSIEGGAAGAEVRPFVAVYAKGVTFEVLQQPVHPKPSFSGQLPPLAYQPPSSLPPQTQSRPVIFRISCRPLQILRSESPPLSSPPPRTSTLCSHSSVPLLLFLHLLLFLRLHSRTSRPIFFPPTATIPQRRNPTPRAQAPSSWTTECSDPAVCAIVQGRSGVCSMGHGPRPRPSPLQRLPSAGTTGRQHSTLPSGHRPQIRNGARHAKVEEFTLYDAPGRPL